MLKKAYENVRKNGTKLAEALIEAGFEFVCDHNGVKLFRKRKRKSGPGEI